MKIFSLKSLFFLIPTLLFNNVALAEKHLEVNKLYELYSQDILTVDQLNSGLEKMDLNNENMKNLISLRKDGVITENDFIDGVKKVIADLPNLENEIKDNKSVIIADSKKYEFQTEVTSIHRYVVGDFKYGEIWKHMFVLDNDKITEMTFKNSQNIDLISFSKPRLKLLKDNRFSIRSSATYLTDPSIGIRFDFKGQFQDNKIIGETEITYTGSDAPGTVLLKAKTNY